MASLETLPAAALEAEAVLVERARASARARPPRRPAVVSAILATAFLATAVALATFFTSGRSLDLRGAPLLVLAFAVAAHVQFEVGTARAAATQLAFVPLALAVPARDLPLVVAFGWMAAELPQLVRGRLPFSRLPILLVNSWYAVGPAAVLLLAGDPTPSARHWRLYLAALAAQFVADCCIGAIWARAAFGVSMSANLREASLPFVVDAALAPLGFSIGLRVAYQPLAILLVLPLVGLLGYFARERRQRLDHAIELSHAYRGTALLLGDVIEADDAYTGSHSRAVVELTLAVSDRLGLEPAARRDAELAALLHDVGKVRIPSELINKPGPLDADERALMDTHTIEGERMLEQVGGLLGHVGHIVRSCHERWDGSGYPDGLAGEQIPLAARIVSCCDAYHAMTSDRPYRLALAPAAAREELRRGRGTQFDPRVVDALLVISS